MSTPTFTQEQLREWAENKCLWADSTLVAIGLQRGEVARYALALEAELDAEKANLNRANDEFEKARAALEAERDALRAALLEEETTHANTLAGYERENACAIRLEAENVKLREVAALVWHRFGCPKETAEEIQYHEYCPRCSFDTLLGEKDGGK